MDNYTPPTIKIPLTKDYVAIIDEQDSDLAQLNWQVLKGNRSSYYAARQYTTGVYTFMHKIILERKIGRSLKKGELCDHKNGISTDNRRENLRIASPLQNAQNRKLNQNNKSGYKGVYFHKKQQRWVAHIRVNNKHISLGGYSTPEEANKAYCEAAIKYFGEFVRKENES